MVEQYSDLPQTYRGEIVVGVDGNIDLNILGTNKELNSNIMVVSDHIRTNSQSQTGDITLEAPFTGQLQGYSEYYDSVRTSSIIIDKIYTKNQSKSDSINKFMRILSDSNPRYLKLKGENLNTGDKVYYEISFVYKS